MSFTYYRDPHIRYVANQSEGEVFTLQTGQLSCVMSLLLSSVMLRRMAGVWVVTGRIGPVSL